MWYLKELVSMVLLLLFALPLYVISRLVSTFLKLMSRFGAVQSVRSRRTLVRVLRAVPFRQFYRSDARTRRLLARPFALDLHAADPASFIGKTESEITRLFRAEPVFNNSERGHEHIEWRRGSQRVECLSYYVCTDCYFYVRGGDGHWVLIAKARKVNLQ